MICLLIIFLVSAKELRKLVVIDFLGKKMSWKSEGYEISNGAIRTSNGTGGTEGEHLLMVYHELFMPQTTLIEAFMHSQCPHKYYAESIYKPWSNHCFLAYSYLSLSSHWRIRSPHLSISFQRMEVYSTVYGFSKQKDWLIKGLIRFIRKDTTQQR